MIKSRNNEELTSGLVAVPVIVASNDPDKTWKKLSRSSPSRKTVIQYQKRSQINVSMFDNRL
jgi:hypothetical protein